MILLIDNYDSFSYNLVQLIGSICEEHFQEGKNEIKVIRNDEMTVEEVEALKPSHLILSPGPGKPKEAGICEAVIEHMKGKAKILGVCLGHQSICEVFGAEITYAQVPMHGKQSEIQISGECKIFEGIEGKVLVARYHSLAAKRNSIPKDLIVTAAALDGEIMAVKHKEYEIYGLQFHPESVLTPDGRKMIENFLKK